jgi:tetratricopeptide (TPR) repeat protein
MNSEVMMKPVTLLLPVLALAVATPARHAAADACPADAAQRARLLYEEGAKHYHLNEFSDAAELFKQSYKACPASRVLYNIGQSYRLLGDNEKALLFYRQYLNTITPDDPYKADVNKLISDLQEEIKKKSQVKEAPPTGVAPTSSPKPNLAPSMAATEQSNEPVRATPRVVKRGLPPRRKALIAVGIVGGAVVIGGVIALSIVFGAHSNYPQPALMARGD